MREKINRALILFIVLGVFLSADAFAQVKEEREEAAIEALTRDVIKQKREFHRRFYSNFDISAGFETNPKLSTLRRADIFEEFLFSLSYVQPINEDLRFVGYYDADVFNYNEMTDLSSILNHVRLGLDRKYERFLGGTGYDVSYLYYPLNENSDFLFHKVFAYMRQNLTRDLYHQFLAEAGVKNYVSQKSIADSLTTIQEKERKDYRQSLEYSVGAELAEDLFLKFRTRYSINNSNAHFQDYYDYHSYDFSPRLSYALSKNLLLSLNYTYTRKIYEARNATSKNDEQVDKIHDTSLGLRYRLSKQDSASVMYTYRETKSNDSASRYTDSIVSAGWRHNF